MKIEDEHSSSYLNLWDFGIYEWPDGKRYEGEFSDDKRHGNGRFQWKDGKVYEGPWSKGKQHWHNIVCKQMFILNLQL